MEHQLNEYLDWQAELDEQIEDEERDMVETEFINGMDNEGNYY